MVPRHDGPSPDDLGRRESNKRATRAALRSSATRLFAERGVVETSVRDIAAAAGVTERTFFRYFASKEDLLIDDAFAWMPGFQAEVLNRPATEDLLTAMRESLKAFAAVLVKLDRPSPLALFAENTPAQAAPISGRALMLRLEGDIADVLEQRLNARPGRRSTTSALDTRARAELAARASVAAFRTAMIYDLRLRRADQPDRPTLSDILDDAFRELSRSRR